MLEEETKVRGKKEAFNSKKKPTIELEEVEQDLVDISGGAPDKDVLSDMDEDKSARDYGTHRHLLESQDD